MFWGTFGLFCWCSLRCCASLLCVYRLDLFGLVVWVLGCLVGWSLGFSLPVAGFEDDLVWDAEDVCC
jgi:hypothetical protein